MSNIVHAWLHTVNNKMGIFDTGFDAKAYAEGTQTDCDAASAADDAVSSASPTAYGNTNMPTSQVDSLEAHHLWIGFFLQAWQASTIHCIPLICTAISVLLCAVCTAISCLTHCQHFPHAQPFFALYSVITCLMHCRFQPCALPFLALCTATACILHRHLHH